MFKKLQTFTLQLLAGANIGVIILLLIIGYSGRIQPVDHPRLATLGLSFPLPLLLNFLFLVFWLFVKKRFAWIPLLGFMLAYQPVRSYWPLNIPRSAPEGAIKVLSYNVAGFGMEGNKEEPYGIAEYLKASDADIICLQEAAGYQQHLDSVLQPAYPYHSQIQKSNVGSVLAVYSRFPIHRVERIDYPSDYNFSMAYELDVDGKPLLLVNNHFETNRLVHEERAAFNEMIKGKVPSKEAKAESRLLINKLADAAKLRAPQVDAVARYVASRRGGKSVILVGDFNEAPISYAHYRFGKLLTDCYAATANGPGFSFNRNHILVRIDNIYCSDNLTPYDCSVDKSIGLSDHYPILCYIKWR